MVSLAPNWEQNSSSRAKNVSLPWLGEKEYGFQKDLPSLHVLKGRSQQRQFFRSIPLVKTLKLHHNGFSNSSRTTLGTMETTSSCCFDRFVCVWWCMPLFFTLLSPGRLCEYIEYTHWQVMIKPDQNGFSNGSRTLETTGSCCGDTVDGRHPAPPRIMIIPLFIGF